MKNKIIALMAAAFMLGSSAIPALAYQQRPYYGYSNYRPNYQSYQRKQYTQKALIGGAAGALIGGLMGSGNGETASGAIKGTLLGAGVGLGYEYLKQKGLF